MTPAPHVRIAINLDSGEFAGSAFTIGTATDANAQSLTGRLYAQHTLEIEFRRDSTLDSATIDMGADPGITAVLKKASGDSRFDAPSLIPSPTFTRAGSSGAYYYTAQLDLAQPSLEKLLGVDYRNQYEQFTLLCTLDTAGDSAGKFVDLYTSTSALFRAWFDVDNTSSAPDAGGGTLIEVDISSGDSAATKAAALKAAIEASGTFAAAYTITISTATLTFTAKQYGRKGEHLPGNSGFTLTMVYAGMAFLAEADVDSYALQLGITFEDDSGEIQIGDDIGFTLKNTTYRPGLAAIAAGGDSGSIRAGTVDITSGHGTGANQIVVTFDTPFPDNTWRFADLRVINTTDGSPLNMWPGIVTAKSNTGFTVALNGDTDSANYDLTYLCTL